MLKNRFLLASSSGRETTPSPLDVLWCRLFCSENSIVNSPERGAAMPLTASVRPTMTTAMQIEKSRHIEIDAETRP
jgi:hypothetical protein